MSSFLWYVDVFSFETGSLGEACQWACLFYKYPVLFNYVTV